MQSSSSGVQFSTTIGANGLPIASCSCIKAIGSFFGVLTAGSATLPLRSSCRSGILGRSVISAGSSHSGKVSSSSRAALSLASYNLSMLEYFSSMSSSMSGVGSDFTVVTEQKMESSNGVCGKFFTPEVVSTTIFTGSFLLGTLSWRCLYSSSSSVRALAGRGGTGNSASEASLKSNATGSRGGGGGAEVSSVYHSGVGSTRLSLRGCCFLELSSEPRA
mmetsp:Transcript_16952/g.30465  ORF Transcript_16952/g.30465 Transcript_16952/m.30465 type:complete len:219 (-) Transcript_16952:14997-15653(-)